MFKSLAIGICLAFCVLPVAAQRASAVYVYTATARPIAGTELDVDVVAIDGNSNPLAITTAVWSTSNAALAEFRDGKIQVKSPGMVDLAVTILGARGLLRLQVLPARVEVTPANPKIEVGQEVAFKAAVFNARGETLSGVTIRWDIVGLDGFVNNGIALNASSGRMVASSAGRYRVRANIDYPNSGSGQFSPIFTSATELTVEARRTFRSSIIGPSQMRLAGLRLTPRATSISMNEAGDLAFLASTEGLGTAVMRARGKALEVAALTGDSMVRPGTVVTDFDDARIGPAGEILARAIHFGVEVYATSNSLYFLNRPGVARGATLGGVITGGADNLTGFRLGRKAFNGSSHYVYSANFFLPGTRTNRIGIFLSDGSFDERLFVNTDTLPGLRAPFNFSQEFGLDDQDNLWFIVNDADGKRALCYRGYNDGRVQVLISPTQPLNGYKPDSLDWLKVSPGGTAAVRMRDNTLGWQLAVLPGPNLAQARTRAINSDSRGVFDVNSSGDVLLFGEMGAGTGLYLLSRTGTMRAIALLQRPAANGEIYTDFRDGALNNKGDVAFVARTSATATLIVRDRGALDEIVFPQPDLRLADPIRMTFTGFLTGSRNGPPLLSNSASQFGIAMLAPEGPRVMLAPDMALPSGQFYSETSIAAAQPDGSVLISANAAIYRYRNSGVDMVGPGLTNIPGGTQFIPFSMAANSRGGLLSLHSTSLGASRLNLTSNGQTRFLGWFGNPVNPAQPTPAPNGGSFQTIGQIDIDDLSNAYAFATTSAGATGIFAHNGTAWRALLQINETQIDGNIVRTINAWDVGNDRMVAAVQYGGGRSGIVECQFTAPCRTRFDQSSDLPLGGLVGNFNSVSMNRKNEIAFTYSGASTDVLVFAAPGEAPRQVLSRTDPLPAGEWMLGLRSIQLQDNSHIYITAFTSNDNYVVLEAEPIN